MKRVVIRDYTSARAFDTVVSVFSTGGQSAKLGNVQFKTRPSAYIVVICGHNR